MRRKLKKESSFDVSIVSQENKHLAEKQADFSSSLVGLTKDEVDLYRSCLRHLKEEGLSDGRIDKAIFHLDLETGKVTKDDLMRFYDRTGNALLLPEEVEETVFFYHDELRQHISSLNGGWFFSSGWLLDVKNSNRDFLSKFRNSIGATSNPTYILYHPGSGIPNPIVIGCNQELLGLLGCEKEAIVGEFCTKLQSYISRYVPLGYVARFEGLDKQVGKEPTDNVIEFPLPIPFNTVKEKSRTDDYFGYYFLRTGSVPFESQAESNTSSIRVINFYDIKEFSESDFYKQFEGKWINRKKDLLQSANSLSEVEKNLPAHTSSAIGNDVKGNNEKDNLQTLKQFKELLEECRGSLTSMLAQADASTVVEIDRSLRDINKAFDDELKHWVSNKLGVEIPNNASSFGIRYSKPTYISKSENEEEEREEQAVKHVYSVPQIRWSDGKSNKSVSLGKLIKSESKIR